MILLIDVGNTRLKWGWLDGAHLSEQRAVVHRDTEPESWSKDVFDPARRPSRVLAANVAGEAMAWNLHRFSQQAYGLEPEFITPTRSFHELTNGYLNPALLGADRWLAVIGAWNLAHTALCVVDAGTAVKVDSVNAHGQHLGGLIVRMCVPEVSTCRKFFDFPFPEQVRLFPRVHVYSALQSVGRLVTLQTEKTGITLPNRRDFRSPAIYFHLPAVGQATRLPV